MPKVLLPLAMVVTTPAVAADRDYAVTHFDAIRVDGAFDVEVRTGGAAAVRVEASTAALTTITVKVDAGTLTIRAPVRTSLDPAETGEQVRVIVTTPGLRSAALVGRGTLRIDRMNADAVKLSLNGGGRLDVAALRARRLDAVSVGDGAMALGGNADAALVALAGEALLEGDALTVGDLTLNAQGRIRGEARALRTATIVAAGPSTLAIAGPARCDVRASHPDGVACGGEPTLDAIGSEQPERGELTD